MTRILVIQRDAPGALNLGRTLASKGHDVVTTARAESGLALVSEKRPALIILNCWMPTEEAVSLAARLRERAPEVPLVMISAGRDSWLREVASALGLAGVLQSPVDTAELVNTVSRALESRTPTSAPDEVLHRPPEATSGRVAMAAGGDPASKRSTEGSERRALLRGKKVLLIEDDRNIALALGVRLREIGLKVNVAHDAVTGMSMARKGRPDLLLLDIGLPGGSGLGVAEKLRMMGPGMTPVIFITASRMPGLREQAMKLGASAFLEKPFEAEELARAITDALGLNAS